MKTFISYAYPDHDFWTAYANLWDNSIQKPVFQTPRFIQYLAQRFRQSIAIYQYYKDDKLVGAAFFRKDGNIYKLLSEIKADYNFFVIDKDCKEEETRQFFQAFFKEVKKTKMDPGPELSTLLGALHAVAQKGRKNRKVVPQYFPAFRLPCIANGHSGGNDGAFHKIERTQILHEPPDQTTRRSI